MPDYVSIMIPEALISRETLTYVGLSEAKGDEIWGNWTNWPADDGPGRETDPDDGGLQVSFHDFIIGCVTYGNKRDTTGESDTEWRECLDTCGIASDTQDAIMDPNFTFPRLSRSCLAWVRDTIDMRYAGLEHIHSSRVGAGREDGGQRSISGLQQQSTTAGISVDAWGLAPAAAAAASNAPGYTVLYKAVDLARIS